jgi:hypothetical protein
MSFILNISDVLTEVRYFDHAAVAWVRAIQPSFGTHDLKSENPGSPMTRAAGVHPELPIRIELMTFSLRVKRSTD